MMSVGGCKLLYCIFCLALTKMYPTRAHTNTLTHHTRAKKENCWVHQNDYVTVNVVKTL